MNLNRKVEMVKQAIDSIFTHDDEDHAAVTDALAQVGAYVGLKIEHLPERRQQLEDGGDHE